MNEHHRQTIRRTALVHIEDVRRLYGQLVATVGFDLRVQSLHGALLDLCVRYGPSYSVYGQAGRD
ncbi:hypothetical protein D9M68_972310 [compost metagenome]